MLKLILTSLTILHLTLAFPSDMPTIIQKSTDEMSTDNPITTFPSILSTDIENSPVSTMDTKVSEMDKNPASNTIASYETTMADSNNIEKMPTISMDTKISEINSPTMDKMTESEGTGMTTNEMSTSMKDSTAETTNSMTQSTSNSMESSLSSSDVAMNMIATKPIMTASPDVDVDVMDTTNNLKREQLNEAEMTTIMESMGHPMTTEKLMEKSQEMPQTEPPSESANVEATTMKPADSSMMPDMTMKPVMTEEATKKNAMVEEMTTMMTETKTMMTTTTEKTHKPGTAKPLTATMMTMETTTKMKNDGNLLKFSALMMFSVSSILVMVAS